MAAARKATSATRLPATTLAPSFVPSLGVPCEKPVLPLLLDPLDPVAALPAAPEVLALSEDEPASPRAPPPLIPGTVSTSAVLLAVELLVAVPLALPLAEDVPSGL